MLDSLLYRVKNFNNDMLGKLKESNPNSPIMYLRMGTDVYGFFPLSDTQIEPRFITKEISDLVPEFHGSYMVRHVKQEDLDKLYSRIQNIGQLWRFFEAAKMPPEYREWSPILIVEEGTFVPGERYELSHKIEAFRLGFITRSESGMLDSAYPHYEPDYKEEIPKPVSNSPFH